MDFKTMIIDDITRATSFVTLYLALFLLAKWVKDIFAPYNINQELTKADNLAIAVSMSGYYLAITAIFVGALIGPSAGLKEDVLSVGGYSLLGLVLLNLSRWFNDTMILREFCNTQQLVKERNVSVGAAHCGAYLATGIIAAGAVSGQGGGVVTSIVFFVLGQLSLFIFSIIYEKFSSYTIHDALLSKNTASGIAFGGNLVALSIIIMNATAGDFTHWQKDILLFASANITAFLFLTVIRLVMDRLVVPGDSLRREIKEDKNIGAGLLEAIIAISFAVILTTLIS
jgi:uncharacterized membrane protein YjfL (UPF0719 family)